MQYVKYMKTLLTRRPRRQHASRRPVTTEIRDRFPATIELAIAAMVFAVSIGLPLGFIRAKHYGRPGDHAALIVSLIGISIPVFFLAIMLKYVFAVKLGWLPSVGREDILATRDHPTDFYTLDAIINRDPAGFWDAVKHLILPAIALGSIPLAIITRITRASVVDVQNEDYVRTARAKGLAPAIVDRRHVLRNALLPDHDHHRPADGPAALGRGADRDDLRLSRDGLLAGDGDHRTATTRYSRAASSSSRSSSCS